MLKKILRNKYIILIFVIWVLFSYPYFFLGKTPYPSDYQTNAFSPADSYPGFAGPVKNNAQPDIIGQLYPWRYFAIQELKQGSIPFWNPYSFGGTPHLANYQSAVLFPLNVLFFLPGFKFIDVWGFLVVLQPLLAGIFMFFLMRTYKSSEHAGLLSSISFMFCGFITTWMGYATLGYAILFLPLAILSIEKYLAEKKHYWLIILSTSIAFSYLSGHFQTSIYFSIGVIGYVFYCLFTLKEKRDTMEVFLFCLFGFLLAMPQILPSIEFYSVSVRSALFQKVEAIPWNYLPTLLAPDYYGNPVTRNDWFGHYAEWNGFAGSVALSFALFAIFFKRNKRTVFYLILSLVALLLAYDTPLLSILVQLKVPVLSTSAASRIIVLFSFSVAVLAGIGFDEMVFSRANSKRNTAIWILSLFIILICIGILSLPGFLLQDKSHLAQKNLILPAVFIILISLASLILFIKKTKARIIFICLVMFLCGFEMYRFAFKWQSFSSREISYPAVGITNFYDQQNHYDRAIGLSGGEDAVYYKTPILSGYDPLYIAEYGEFIKYVESGTISPPDRSVVNFPLNGKFSPQAIKLLGVKYIVHKASDGNFSWAFPFDKYPLSQFTKIYDDSYYQVFRNNDVLNRVFLAHNTKVFKKKEDILPFIFSKDLSQNVATYEEVDGLDAQATGTAQISKYLPNDIVVNVSSTGNSILVLTDPFYPGWKVKVNGQPGKILKVDYIFRGVVVPKGNSIVEFSYNPQSFFVGVYLFLLGILGIIICTIIKSFKYND